MEEKFESFAEWATTEQWTPAEVIIGALLLLIVYLILHAIICNDVMVYTEYEDGTIRAWGLRGEIKLPQQQAEPMEDEELEIYVETAFEEDK